jgi:hypothetical protein
LLPAGPHHIARRRSRFIRQVLQLSPTYRATLSGCAALALWAFLAPLARLAQPLPPLLTTGLGFAAGGGLGLLVVLARGGGGRLAAALR